MLKPVMMSLTGLMILALIACGAAATAPAAPTAEPERDAATATQPAPAAAVQGETLQAAAARLAGGPGAIYVGDLTQLVGPTRDLDLGFGEDGMIPLDILQGNEWIYESDYYKFLLDRANFDNPTELVTQGQSMQIQYACINRALFVPRQLEMPVASIILAGSPPVPDPAVEPHLSGSWGHQTPG